MIRLSCKMLPNFCVSQVNCKFSTRCESFCERCESATWISAMGEYFRVGFSRVGDTDSYHEIINTPEEGPIPFNINKPVVFILRGSGINRAAKRDKLNPTQLMVSLSVCKENSFLSHRSAYGEITLVFKFQRKS